MEKSALWSLGILFLICANLTFVAISKICDQANTKLGDCITLNDTKYARTLMCKKEK